MSFAILINTKYKKTSVNDIYKHNERRNYNYSNRNIDKSRTYLNYSIIECKQPYLKRIKEIITENNVLFRYRKNSNIMCEYVITSDKEYFKVIGESETRRFFECATKFVESYKNLGKKYIISAVVHMDESKPHMHITFIPVVHKKDINSGKLYDKLAYSEFFSEKYSYRNLQQSFYEFMTKNNFFLEKGSSVGLEKISIERLKKLTRYDLLEKYIKEGKKQEREENEKYVSVGEYNKVITDYNMIYDMCAKLTNVLDRLYELKRINTTLRKNYYNLINKSYRLKRFIQKLYVAIQEKLNIDKKVLYSLFKDTYK